MTLTQAAPGNANVLHFVMVKPSHYDDDGYPIQWVRSAIPSNTLACLNGLAEDACRRQVLGPDVEIRLHTYDETNRRVRPDLRGPAHRGRVPLLRPVVAGRRSLPDAAGRQTP